MAAEIGLKCYEKALEYILGIFPNRRRAEETMKFWKWDFIFEKGVIKKVVWRVLSKWREVFGASNLALRNFKNFTRDAFLLGGREGARSPIFYCRRRKI